MQDTEVAAWSIQAALELPLCILVPSDICGSCRVDGVMCRPHGAVLCFHNTFGSAIGNTCIALNRLPKNFKRGKKKKFKEKRDAKVQYLFFICVFSGLKE